MGNYGQLPRTMSQWKQFMDGKTVTWGMFRQAQQIIMLLLPFMIMRRVWRNFLGWSLTTAGTVEPHYNEWSLNTLRRRQDGRHFSDDILKYIFLNENIWIAINISLSFVPKGPIDNIPALVQIMAWRRSGDKPLSEPMMVSLLTAEQPQR